jgi:hypothetical protein
MANHYLMKYKGIYRILPELDTELHDIPRDYNGEIADGYNDIYIACQYGNKIYEYGHINNTKPVWLVGYIPSLGRGHNIIKALKEKEVEYIDYRETDEEVEFKFKAKDIEVVAELMKAKTSGADISPFSIKNLPKSDVKIPTEEIARYKEITSIVPKSDLLLIHRLTNSFLDDILQKSLRKATKDKKFSYKDDMKSMCMSRQAKEYIWVKGYFEEYLNYLKKEFEKIYK